MQGSPESSDGSAGQGKSGKDDESEAALIVVGEATVERAVEEQTKRAKKEMKKEVRADAKEMEKAIDEA